MNHPIKIKSQIYPSHLNFWLCCKLTLFFLPSLSYAFFCPTNFNQIDFGMTTDQVTQICGQPDNQKEYKKEDENIPQEWNYYIPQTVSMGGTLAPAQGTLKTSITFDNKGKAINISVNGIGVGESTVCGGSTGWGTGNLNNPLAAKGATIALGATRDQIKAACGTPAFINKQQVSANDPNAKPPSKVVEFEYLNATPKTTLIFENGMLKDKK